MKRLYFTRVLNRDPSRLNVRPALVSRHRYLSVLLLFPYGADVVFFFSEIQDSYRGPATQEAHGLPWGCRLADIMKAREEFGYQERSGTRRAFARSIYWVVGKVEQLRRL
jgi:hypothetical protein